MNKVRNESDITQVRRWVMELLQNARDLAWSDKPLQVQIELRQDALIFRHSGMPFGVDDILSIVNQVSSKNPGEGVGQFGTGFMTTYQLSERVEIHSLLKEEGTVAVKDDRDVAMRINNVVQKLLTPKAAASMHKKAKGYAQLMEVLGTQDPEELEKLMLQAKQMGSMGDKLLSGGGAFDDDADMWLDGDLLELEEDERKQVCSEIGLAGEQYVFEQVRQRLVEQGFQVLEEDENQIKLSGSDGEYTILRPDTVDYHQAGWDITVIRRSQNEESGLQPEETSWYLEVKTHTLKSVRKGQLFVSNEQMKMAADRGDHYILLYVAYDYPLRQVAGVKVYENLCRQLATGKLVNVAGRYCFEER